MLILDLLQTIRSRKAGQKLVNLQLEHHSVHSKSCLAHYDHQCSNNILTAGTWLSFNNNTETKNI